MKRNYHTLDNQGKSNEGRLAKFLTKNGLLGSPVYAFLERGLDSGRPQRIWDRRFSCTSASPSLERRSCGFNAAGLSDFLCHRPLALRAEERQ